MLREHYVKANYMRGLDEDIALHLAFGYLIKTPTYIAMGKPIVRWMSDEEIRDPRIQVPAGYTPDAWLCYAFAGSACDFTSFMPYYLPYVAWHRRGNLRYHTTKIFLKACKSMTPYLIESYPVADSSVPAVLRPHHR